MFLNVFNMNKWAKKVNLFLGENRKQFKSVWVEIDQGEKKKVIFLGEGIQPVYLTDNVAKVQYVKFFF